MWILWILFPKTDDNISRFLFMQASYCYWLIHLNLTVHHFHIEKGHKILKTNFSSCWTLYSFLPVICWYSVGLHNECLHDPSLAAVVTALNITVPPCRTLSWLLLRTCNESNWCDSLHITSECNNPAFNLFFFPSS